MNDPLPLDEARARIARLVVPLVDTGRVPLREARGRVLAADLDAPLDVPPHANAAMDGYALSVDTARAHGARVVGTALAGHPFAGEVATGDCVRIMTGAVLPAGCDAVVPIEDASARDDRIAFDVDVVAGRHVRLAGEDLRAGTVALARGRRLRASDIGLAASLGVGELAVVRRPRVAVFSTGDELVDVLDAPHAGGIRDSNRPALVGLCDALGVDVVDAGIVRDDRDALAAALDRARDVDAIVTSGGVSAGDADHVRALLEARGRVEFWKLAVKPGRPMAFGTLDATDGRRILFFGLPGNPVAALVAFHALVRDALLRLAGASAEPLVTLVARAAVRFAKAPGRTEFVRAVATRDAAGWSVRPTGDQGSGILRSLRDANCLVVLPHDRADVAEGELVEAWPSRGLDA